jgi:flagellin
MGLRIGTNTQSLNAQRTLGTHQKAQGDATRRLASGIRINQAADDPSGLAIATKMSATARSMGQALRNTQDGISLIQVTEGAMQEIGSMLIRLRELGIQASSDTVGNSERSMINSEVLQLRSEIERTAQSTEFNGKKVLDGGGSWPTLQLQVGIDNNDTSRIDVSRKKLNSDLAHLGLVGIDFSNRNDAREFLEVIDDAMTSINSHRATMGALQNTLQSSANNTGLAKENVQSSRSRIIDTDVAVETAEMTKDQILSQSVVSVLSQANQNPQQALRLLSA